MNFEIQEIRKMSKEMFDLKELDSKLNFFYDETNNIRRFQLKQDKLNESIKTNFILGGIVLEEAQKVDLRPLFDSFGLQKNVVEVKLKNLAKGNFSECLTSIHLQSIFKFLLSEKLFIHYSSLNFLYFSTVDIIDSLIEATGIEYDLFYNRALKNDLYICVKKNIEEFITLFYEYEYPNIKKDKASNFIDKLIVIFSKEPKSKGNSTILILLKESKKTENLFFIMDEKNHELIENFTHFYSRTIYLFLNSKHIFDKEESIEPLIKELNMTNENNKVQNYIFVDSQGNQFIQLSDIIIGFIGKYFNFINDNSFSEIKTQLDKLNETQRKTLKLFIKILFESEKRNKAYIHLTVSNNELQKMDFIKNYA
jgi:hypothetical protein